MQLVDTLGPAQVVMRQDDVGWGIPATPRTASIGEKGQTH